MKPSSTAPPARTKVRRAKAPPAAAPRRRRTAEEARAAILNATEEMLVEHGPAGIRLQQVADAVGVSHPTVLHHFQSREGLVRAVVARAGAALHADVLAAIAQASLEPDQIAALLERVFEAFGARGHARALAWLALSGEEGGPDGLELEAVAKVVHARRRAQCPPERPPPPPEDSFFLVLLPLLSLFGAAVAGPMLTRGSSHTGPRADARFRKWLAELVLLHLQRGQG